jgi:hypothetical protein
MKTASWKITSLKKIRQVIPTEKGMASIVKEIDINAVLRNYQESYFLPDLK